MVKLLVISDTHGDKKSIDYLVNTVSFDYLIHLGDGLNDLGQLEYMNNLIQVRGNCDFFSKEKTDEYRVIDGVKILMTHGQNYGVKTTINNLAKKAYELDLDLVLYGHTHRPSQQTVGKTLFVNCGSLRHSHSFFIIEIDNGKILANLHSF